MKRKVAIQRALDEQNRHAYTILAWSEGFEYVFPTGVKRWSTLNNRNAAKVIDFKAEEIRKWKWLPSLVKTFKFLKLARLDHRWVYSKVRWYASKEIAINSEQKELDLQRSKYDWPQYG